MVKFTKKYFIGLMALVVLSLLMILVDNLDPEDLDPSLASLAFCLTLIPMLAVSAYYFINRSWAKGVVNLVFIPVVMFFELCFFSGSGLFLHTWRQAYFSEKQRMVFSIGKYQNRMAVLEFINRRHLTISKSQIDAIGLDWSDVVKKLMDNGWAVKYNSIFNPFMQSKKEDLPAQVQLEADVREEKRKKLMATVFGDKFPIFYPVLEKAWAEQIIAHAHPDSIGFSDTDPYIEFDDLSLLPSKDIADVKQAMIPFEGASSATESKIAECYLIDYEILSKREEIYKSWVPKKNYHLSSEALHSRDIKLDPNGYTTEDTRRTYYIGKLNKVSSCPQGAGGR